jgi:hypothetical protein
MAAALDRNINGMAVQDESIDNATDKATDDEVEDPGKIRTSEVGK